MINKEKPTVPCFSQMSGDQRNQIVKAVQDKHGEEMEEKEKKFTESI